MFSVIFKVDDEEWENESEPAPDDLVIGEGKNIDEAFASIRSQIELFHSDLPWKLAAIKYCKPQQR